MDEELRRLETQASLDPSLKPSLLQAYLRAGIVDISDVRACAALGNQVCINYLGTPSIFQPGLPVSLPKNYYIRLGYWAISFFIQDCEQHNMNARQLVATHTALQLIKDYLDGKNVAQELIAYEHRIGINRDIFPSVINPLGHLVIACRRHPRQSVETCFRITNNLLARCRRHGPHITNEILTQQLGELMNYSASQTISEVLGPVLAN